MIKYDLTNINKWYNGSRNIVKCYHGTTNAFDLTGGGAPVPPTPTGQTPCYAVTNDISQYQATDFVDVYDTTADKWYKLNNLNEYEEYGIYGSGRTNTTYYEGKLTIDDEITPAPAPSRLPQGYTEVEYIRNSNYNAYINTGIVLFDNKNNTYTITTKLTSEFHSNLSCATIIACENPVSPYYGLGYRYKCSSTVDQLEFYGQNPNYTSSVVDNGDGTRTVTFQSSGATTWTLNTPLIFFANWSDRGYSSTVRPSDATIYSSTVVKNGVTVRDFVPAKRDSDSKYGLYDLITDTFYTSPNGNNFSGGTEVTPQPTSATCEFVYSGNSWVNLGEVSGSTYPQYYDEIADPPTSVTFATMADALAYQCPYVGLRATIAGDNYIFNSNYEWEEVTSRLPVGYTEVEYIQNTGTSYLNIAFVPNQDTRVIMEYQLVTDSGAGRFWGAGAWNSATGIEPNYEGGYLQISWLGKSSWTKFNNFPLDYNKHVLDLNKNYLYLDETLVGSNTYTTRTASDPIGVFTYIGSGRPSSSKYWGIEHFLGKMFTFKVYNNGTLVRDLVPCVRDNDNEVGAYDIVNDVFYTVPTGYTTDKLIAGNPV